MGTTGARPTLVGDLRPTADRQVWASEQDLAWDLVEHCRSILSIAELNTVFIRLGCGQYIAVIDTALTAVARAETTMTPELTIRLMRWVVAYEGHSRQRRLRDLIEDIRRRTPPPI